MYTKYFHFDVEPWPRFKCFIASGHCSPRASLFARSSALQEFSWQHFQPGISVSRQDCRLDILQQASLHWVLNLH